MKVFFETIGVLFFLFFFNCEAQIKPLSSPNGNIILTVKNQDGSMFFSVTYGNDIVVNLSPLGINLQEDSLKFQKNLKIISIENKQINEAYTMFTGKQSKRVNYCNQITYKVENEFGNRMLIAFRAYNDAVAYKYILENPNESSVTQELSGFNFNTIKTLWTLEYSSGDERLFEEHSNTDSLQNKILSLPSLIEAKTGHWMLATEAHVSNYPLSGCIYENNRLQFKFPSKQKGKNVVGKNFELPWRVLIMAEKIGGVVQSCVVDHLNPASKLEDTSWVQSGVNSFPWWGNNLANSSPDEIKKYIDLSSKLGWKYVEFDLPLIGSPARAVEDWKTTTWIKDVVDYGLSKNVKCFGWDEFKNLNTPEKRRAIFSKYKALGMVGCKVDFINDYSQEARKILEDIIQDAAKYKLMLSFHGAQSPRGFARTYPHIMTYEAVKGAEYYLSINGASGLTPHHNTMQPYTRNVLGSMDYTPVAFTTSLRKSTAAHELALSVVFESGWQGLCDVPNAYLNSPAKDFLSQLHASWDETKFIDGKPGAYCFIARRKGNYWYVAGISALDAKTFSVDLSAIISKTTETTIYSDALGKDDSLVKKKIWLSPNKPLIISLKKNGGFAFIIKSNTKHIKK